MELDPYGILVAPSCVNAAHNAELAERPLGTQQRLTAEQHALRIEVGKITTRLVYEDCLRTQPHLAPLYLKHPPYLFYTTGDGDSGPRMRIFGWGSTPEGEPRAHVVSAHLVVNSVLMGGIAEVDLVAMTQWRDSDEQFLRSGLVPDAGAFLDPLGFFRFAAGD